MKKYGLIGEKLGHSYSPEIHALLGNYEYKLYPMPREAVGDFVQNGGLSGFNVTIPYKETVMPFLDRISPEARRIGSVNTVVRESDGSTSGYNTDYFGFSVELGDVSRLKGKKALVLGSGGASVTVVEALRQLGAREVVVVSRSGENNYENLNRHADAALIVNTTPVGMYPNNGKAALSLGGFPSLRGVLDVVYNPARTALILDAERRGIPCLSGLRMLVAQAKASAEQFTGTEIPDSRVEEIFRALSAETGNVVLVGMPGSGKSAVGRAVAEALGRPFLDADREIVRAAGMEIPEIFAAQGEGAFRDLESRVLAELGKQSGCVIATGGGSVLREENYDALHQNGTIFWLQRDLNALPRDGRPLSQGADLAAMYAARKPRYERFADHAVSNDGPLQDTVRQILDAVR